MGRRDFCLSSASLTTCLVLAIDSVFQKAYSPVASWLQGAIHWIERSKPSSQNVTTDILRYYDATRPDDYRRIPMQVFYSLFTPVTLVFVLLIFALSGFAAGAFIKNTRLSKYLVGTYCLSSPLIAVAFVTVGHPLRATHNNWEVHAFLVTSFMVSTPFIVALLILGLKAMRASGVRKIAA